jgi:hypothetical protein
MDENEIIARVQYPNYTHASAPNARAAFLEGQVLFDVTAEARRFNEFFATNPDLRSQASKTVKMDSWGSVCAWPAVGAPKILITVNKMAWNSAHARETRDLLNELIEAGART